MKTYKKITHGLFLAALISFSSIEAQSQETPYRVQQIINAIENRILVDEATYGDEYQVYWIRVHDMLVDGKYKAAIGILGGLEKRLYREIVRIRRNGDQDDLILNTHHILAQNYSVVIERDTAS
jgi:hypothetical protein